ncbi:uncharacterized protein LOC128873789 [Hylaeus volcanicus]|uniref:uncharacterized protein LOC128873789 n=1 Tax=Hylaeus volcanicus TaxID=313075 RepID=UPI0023B86326|nr:uncharacterized protein LOC128873789 [Hylaeus volcanicus]
MSSSVGSSTIFLFFLIFASVTKCWDLDEAEKKLDQLVGGKSLRSPRNSKDVSPIWMDYEFNTGAGNREELVVTDISVHEYTNLPETGTNWQFLEVNDTGYLARTERSILWLHQLDSNGALTDEPAILNIGGLILAFKVIGLSSFSLIANPEIDVVVVLCVASDTGTSLQWYRLVDGKFSNIFWSWPVQKHVKDMEFVQQGNLNKLLILDENEMRFGKQYSHIDVYGFSIDFSTSVFHLWLCQRIPVPRVFDIRVCPAYEGLLFALQGVNDVFLYEYRDPVVGNILQVIKSLDLKNFVCFESGNLQFLAISGPEAGLFHLIEGEFQYNTESDSSFDVSDISWVKNIRLNTYRDESLLLIQLRNYSVIASGWQGTSFKRIQLPSNILDKFDLSTVTVIPKFGFVQGNRFVKFHIDLRNLKHPIQHTTERLLTLQTLLNDTLNRQERILDETEERLDQSYLKNPIVTGFWKIREANVTNATITDDVIYSSVTLGSTNLTGEELSFDVDSYAKILQDLERKLDEIDESLMDALDSNSTQLHFDSDVEVFGNIDVTGNLNVEDLSVQIINDVDVLNDFPSGKGNVIEDKMTFSFIEAQNLTIYALNGVPVKNIRFGNLRKDYSEVNFSRINRMEVKEHLFVESINNVNWETLMRSIVWKDKPAVIPGDTVIEGALIADDTYLDFLNDLRYPFDYILHNYMANVNVTGSKSFDTLVVGRLEIVKTLNGIDFEDFIILNKENVLTEEITFEKLTVEGSCRIDGEIEGLAKKKIKLLNETSDVEADIIFTDITVLGNVTFDKLFVNKRPLNFEDLLLKTEENVMITGTKTFLRDVCMTSNVTITSGIINGHFMNEFVTLDTDQELPNLIKILADVTFGNVTFGATRKLEAFFRENSNSSTNCLEKIIVFKSPITLDGLSFDSLNANVSQEEFARKLNETFQNIPLENLTTETLVAEEIIPRLVNGVDFKKFIDHLDTSNIINEYTVDNLETDRLDVKFINGMSLDEINLLMDRLNKLLTDLSNGNVTLETLRVTGKIDAKSINGQVLQDLYNPDEMGTMIFKENLSIQNLTIFGSANGFDFLERVSDTVLKTDRNIEVTGLKIFNTVNCYQLEMNSINEHPVENLLDPFKDQVLTGPVVVNGSVTVLKEFKTTGNIGSVPFRDLMGRFKSLGNNTFEIHGEVRFSPNLTIENLFANELIQGIDLDSFLKTVVFTNEDNVTISGTKVFENLVTFNDSFIVQDKLNDIDLKKFWKKAVFVDKPFSIRSKIVFKDGMKIEKELTVKTDFDPKSIMGVDINELKLDVLYLNRPTYIKDTITFANVNFQSDIEVSKFNDLDMRLLIPLKTDQTIPVEVLKCRNVTVENIKVLGKVNEEDWKTFRENTLMVLGNQSITGHINFHGHVHTRRNFNAHLLNGIDPTRIISLNSKSNLTGNFVFEKPVVINQGFRVLGYLNGIDLNRWEAVAVTTNNFFQQIISGKWTVVGNVHFKKGASGSDYLNGTNLVQLSHSLAKSHLGMDGLMSETNENLNSVCEDLSHLKHYAENQVYKFSSFDYMQIIEFGSRIVSLHYFELHDLDYLMISYDTCEMHMYLFTGTQFELVVNVTDFGVVDQWSTFNHKRAVYFITSGNNSCGRSSVNLWKLENDEFTHVLSLGKRINNRSVGQDAFLMLTRDNDEKQFQERVNKELEKTLSTLPDDLKAILQNNQVLLNSRHAYKYNVDFLNGSRVWERSKNSENLKFRAGVFEKQMFLYFNEEVSKDRIFICNNGGPQTKILQTIKAHRPTSFSILNFQGLIETLLVFVENGKDLRIYEYNGIQGFVYRYSIRINIDKLISFKVRKHPNLAKRYCLATIHANRLTILEAKMYGEKLDMGTLTCSGR